MTTAWHETRRGQWTQLKRLKIGDWSCINGHRVYRQEELVFVVDGLRFKNAGYNRLLEIVFRAVRNGLPPDDGRRCVICGNRMPIGIQERAIYCCKHCQYLAAQKSTYRHRRAREVEDAS